MAEIKDRVKEIRTKHLKLTQQAFASRVRISQSLLNEIENGGRILTQRTIDLICEFYSVNRDYLLYGKGKPFREDPPDLQKDRLIEIYGQLNGQLKKLLLEQSQLLLKMQNDNEGKKE